MLFILILLFVVTPIAEIYVLITAGGAFGALPVIFACLATGVIGGWIIRMQGLSALNAVQKEMSDGRAPVAPMVDGLLILAAAPFLMTPGFITDIAGFSLLIPSFRSFLRAYVAERMRRHMDQRTGTITINRH